MRRPCAAFTLAELLVSIAVLTVLLLIASRMINSAANIATIGYRRMDAESQVRPVFERMAGDFAQMIKRTDVDYYVKSDVNNELGNDRLAFFGNSPGYYPSSGSQSPVSLISYRINTSSSSSSFNRMERMSKGLVWTGVSPINTPVLFGLQAIVTNWPAATDSSLPDFDYELIGPQIFRFEYFYLLKTGLISDNPGAQGMQDVSAISVVVAAIDEKSRLLLSEPQVTTLIGRLKDFDRSKSRSDLAASWQSTLDETRDMPRTILSGVRIYQRYFNLLPLR
jgi:prepilin-type N-terminal cleavage/methylation domain